MSIHADVGLYFADKKNLNTVKGLLDKAFGNNSLVKGVFDNGMEATFAYPERAGESLIMTNPAALGALATAMKKAKLSLHCYAEGKGIVVSVFAS